VFIEHCSHIEVSTQCLILGVYTCFTELEIGEEEESRSHRPLCGWRYLFTVFNSYLLFLYCDLTELVFLPG